MDGSRLLAVFAHPDDETFRCGGTLALLAQRGVQVHVLTFTRGQAGSCGQPPVCTRENLGAIRTAELQCSCQALGLESPVVLDYEDGALEGVSQEEGAAQMFALILTVRPQVLLTWPLHGLSGHRDHVAVSQWTSTAYQQAEEAGLDDLAALYHLAVPDSIARELGMKQLHTLPDEDVTLTVDVKSVWEKKMAAIACHRTQAGESPILRAPLERQKRFLEKEHFQRAIGRQPGDLLLSMKQLLQEPGDK